MPNEDLWDVFGDHGNGYRLCFEVTPTPATQLRAIRYHGATTLLRRVNEALTNVGLPRFVFRGVSRVGAFYLSAHWQREEEIRLLAKRFPGGRAPVEHVAAHEYWPVPINIPNNTATLNLVEIGVRKLDPDILCRRLPTWCKAVPVVTD